MSAPVRFLALLVVGWAGVRAATLGIVPGFTVSYAKPLARSDPPAIVATRFPELPPLGTEPPQMWPQGLATPYPASMPPPVRARLPVPYYLPYPYAVSASLPQARIPPRPAWQLPSTAASGASGAPAFYTPIPPIEDWELGRYASASFPERRSSAAPAVLAQSPGRQTLDRLQLSSWALLRGAPGPGTLASGGTLGGSQAGARLTYAFNHRVAASLRTTSPVGGSTGAEVAGGIRLTPFPSIPVAFTIERRQSISPHGGRSAFAAFFEGGLYRQPMPLDFNLDAYVQAGIVGANSRDVFADGAFAFTRPVWGRFSAGFGAWGGMQPGLYRIDAGPRVSMRIRDNIHAHADWRQRVVGNAQPSSGPALTLAADF